jgi:hypothetical protein
VVRAAFGLIHRARPVLLIQEQEAQREQKCLDTHCKSKKLSGLLPERSCWVSCHTMLSVLNRAAGVCSGVSWFLIWLRNGARLWSKLDGGHPCECLVFRLSATRCGQVHFLNKDFESAASASSAIPA